jgi:hypothetical protein
VSHDASTQPPSRPVPTATRAQLQQLTQRILDAMIRNEPYGLPLATRVPYTENGVPVSLGEGLWKSLVGLREYGIFLTDPASGQGAWVGTLDEFGLFAALVLRCRTEGGLITELEALIARPEIEAVVRSQTAAGAEAELKGATYTMFVPPLLANLDPAAFAQVDPALLRKVGRTSAADMRGAVDRYYQAFTARNGLLAPLAAGCRRRENGVAASGNPQGRIVDPEKHEFRLYARDCAGELDAGFLARLVQLREQRTLLVDERQGLVLDLALMDNAGSAVSVDIPQAGRVKVPDSCLAPWTDMHAQLFRIDAGRIVHIEGFVRRVPYGQGSGWKA